MATVRVTQTGNREREIPVEPGRSLLETLHSAGVYLPAVCGGKGKCGKCGVRVCAGSVPVTAFDRECLPEDLLEAGYRLACAAFPDGDLGIEVFDTGEDCFSAVCDFNQDGETGRGCGREIGIGTGTGTRIGIGIEEGFFSLEKDAQSYARRLSPERRLSYTELREASKLADAQGRLPITQVSQAEPEAGRARVYRERGRILRVTMRPEPLYAVAVDIGTTTLALALLDLRSGSVAGRFSAVNRQREFGGDVISRIQRANDGGLSLLSRTVRDQIGEGIVALCREASIDIQAIRKIALAGNTTMLHLLLQLSCRTLGQTPFTPVTLDMVSLMSRELFDGEALRELSSETVILPGIAPYVGADITAGLLFAGMPAGPEPQVFMDIGTNGEMALAWKGRILCTATAAGPAFEGGNIRWGTGSIPGAIARARFHDGLFACITIGNRPPVGICGSAVIDIVSQGLKNGLIQPSGRFNTDLLPTDEIVLARTEEEKRDIVFCQKDVREVQLGKSAIRSGLDALLNHAGLGYEDIQTLYLAGGFGFNLDLESAVGIGLIPEALESKVSLIGNSALGGVAQFLLNPDHEKTLYGITRQSEEFSLPNDPYFNDHFIDNLNFDA